MAMKNKSPIKISRPKFDTVLANYKGGGVSARDVTDSVFDGSKTLDKMAVDWIEKFDNNTCALRLSDALNRSGWVLPAKGGKKGEISGWFGSVTKQYYVLGSVQLADLLAISWGYNSGDSRFDTAKLGVSGVSNPIPLGLISSLAGKHGVILFKFRPVPGFEKDVASGHITLWDGSKSVYDTGNCISGPFSNEAAKKAGEKRWVSEIWFFELP